MTINEIKNKNRNKEEKNDKNQEYFFKKLSLILKLHNNIGKPNDKKKLYKERELANKNKQDKIMNKKDAKKMKKMKEKMMMKKKKMKTIMINKIMKMLEIKLCLRLQIIMCLPMIIILS